MRYMDMHCDTLEQALVQKKETVCELQGTMLDIKRLREAGAAGQFFAMFLPQRDEPGWFGLEEMPSADGLLMQMYAVYQNTMEQCADLVAPARSIEEHRKNAKDGKLSAFLTVENGAVVQGSMEKLEKLHQMGVSLMTLTWNDPNCFGYNHSSDPAQMAKGLTDFGKEAVEYMGGLGMLVDVSHLSDGGFYDVADCCKKPFVASHSNCRALSPATRNLTDDMIRILAEHGGVAGINFAPAFVNADVKDAHTTVEGLCRHIEHFIKVGGGECVGIGTDFDGIGGTFEIADCTGMELLFDALHRRGHSDEMIEKLAFRNVERVIADAMKSAHV